MTLNGVFDMLQENVSKPRFCKSLSLGENWKFKSMRVIPEEFVRTTHGAFEHRLVFSVSWGNSWQVWLQRDKNGLFMEEEDWDEFVDDNLLGPDDILFFTHEDTMFTEVRIYKKDLHLFKEVILVPLAAETHTSHQHTPSSAADFAPFASASASASRARQGCVLYVNHKVIQKYPHLSPMHYLLPREKREAVTKIYRTTPCFSGWAAICKKYNKKEGDSVVCELERSGGVVTAVRVHFVDE